MLGRRKAPRSSVMAAFGIKDDKPKLELGKAKEPTDERVATTVPPPVSTTRDVYETLEDNSSAHKSNNLGNSGHTFEPSSTVAPMTTAPVMGTGATPAVGSSMNTVGSRSDVGPSETEAAVGTCSSKFGNMDATPDKDFCPGVQRRRKKTLAEQLMADKYPAPSTKVAEVSSDNRDKSNDNSFTASPVCFEVTKASTGMQKLDTHIETAVMPEPKALMPEPRMPETTTPVVQNSIIEDELDFDLMVETDLDAAWCLESNQKDAGKWRGNCQTASIRRKWEDFETLGQSQATLGDGGLTYSEALELLGLEGEVNAEALAAAFRRQSRHCHPDHGGSESAFNQLIVAKQLISKILTENERKIGIRR